MGATRRGIALCGPIFDNRLDLVLTEECQEPRAPLNPRLGAIANPEGASSETPHGREPVAALAMRGRKTFFIDLDPQPTAVLSFLPGPRHGRSWHARRDRRSDVRAPQIIQPASTLLSHLRGSSLPKSRASSEGQDRLAGT